MEELEIAKPVEKEEELAPSEEVTEKIDLKAFKRDSPNPPISPPRQKLLDLPKDDPSSLDAEEDPWLQIKLYYILDSKRFDQWEDYQNKFLDKQTAEGGGVVKRLLTKQIREITADEKSLLAALAFRTALVQKEESIMCDILRIEQIIDLQVQDLAGLVQKDCFAVLKAIVDKPVPVSRDVKRIFQSSKYHKTERILSFMVDDTDAQYLEVGDIVDYMLGKSISDEKVADLIKFIDNRADKSALKSLLVHRREKLAERLCREGVLTPSDESLVICLEFKCYRFLLAYMQFTNYELSEESIVNVLFPNVIKLLKNDLAHIEIYLYVLRKYKSQFSFSAARGFIELMHDWIHSPDLMVPFVKGSANPVKLCILLLELLKIIKETHSGLAKWAADNSEDITWLVVYLLREINDDTDLHAILTDQDLDGRPAIEIASFNGFLDVFKHKSITTVTEKIWSGPYISTGDPISDSSMLFSNLRHNPFSRLDYFDRSYFKSFQRDYTTFNTHTYQFVTWRDGLRCRYVMESLFYIGLFVYLYLVFYGTVSSIRGGYDIVRVHQVNQESIWLSEVFIVYDHLMDMLDNLVLANTIFLLLFILSFRHIVMIVFAVLTKRNLSPLSLEFVLDFALDGVVILYYYKSYDQVIELTKYTGNKALFLTKVVEFSDNNRWSAPLYTCVVIIAFIRALHTFEVHTVIGPFVKMIKQMAAAMGSFGLLFLLLLLLFALVAYIYNPYEITEYETVYRSALSLYQASVGVFELNDMNDEARTEIFTLIYIVIFNIMLLNLLVAILTQVYTTISVKADMLYVDELVSLHSLYAPHQHYGSLISSYPPFNFVFGWILLPVLLMLPARLRVKVNRVSLYIEYTFAFIPIFAVYLLVQILIFAICYLKVLAHKFALIFMGRDYDHWFKRFFSFFCFLIFGVFTLIPLYFTDAYYFLLHSYLHPGELRFPERSKEPLDKTVFKKLAKFIMEAKKRFPTLLWEKLSKSLYDICSIKIQVSREKKDNSPTETPKSKYMNYRNFTVASQMVQNISVKTDKGEKFIDIEILSLLLENYLFLAKLQKTQARVLNIRMNEMVKQTTAGLTKSATSVGLRKIPSLVVDADEEGTATTSGSGIIFTRLFWTYSLERYTNALISFKMQVNKHWLAKNMLTIASDAQILKGMLVPNSKPQSMQMKSDSIKSPKDSGSREDSILLAKKGTNSKKRGSAEVGQELDSILRKIETGPASPKVARESTVQVTQAQISVQPKCKSSFCSPEPQNDEQ